MNAVIRIPCSFTVALCLALLLACSSDEPAATPPSKPASTPSTSTPPATETAKPPAAPAAPETQDPAALAARGKAVYTANCIACHHPDPKLDGALGPAVAGSSYELLEARIMRAEYPEGYTPKRSTQAMIALPYLEKDLPALAAYLTPLAQGATP